MVDIPIIGSIVDFFRNIYDYLKNFFQSIAGFFYNLWNSIINLFKEIGQWLWSFFTQIFNKIMEFINIVIVNPIQSFTNRVLNRFYQKVDGMIMILVGVPLVWRSVENFIDNPSKKRLKFIPISFVFSWFVSKIVAQIIRTFMSNWIAQGITFPKAISTPVSNYIKRDIYDDLIDSYISFGMSPKPASFDITLSDMIKVDRYPAKRLVDTIMPYDNIVYSNSAQTMLSIMPYDVLASDNLTSSSKTVIKNFINKVVKDTAISDILTSSKKLPSQLKQIDILSTDNILYASKPKRVVYITSSDKLINDTISTIVGPVTTFNQLDILITDSLIIRQAIQTSGKVTYSDNTSAVLYAYDKITYSDNTSPASL